MDDGVERLDTDPPRPPGRAVWLAMLLVGVLVVGGVLLDGRRLDRSVPPPPSPTPTPSRTVRTPSPSPSPSRVGPVTIAGTGPLADRVPAGTLYALNAESLFAIDPVTGTVVRTDGPDMGQQNPVSMVPTDDGVVLQPTDSTTGRFVRDGEPATELTGELREADEVLPGPDGNLWAVRFQNPEQDKTTVHRVDARGRGTGARIADTGSFSSDGSGGLLLSDVGGVWQVSPGPVTQISTGSVSGVGPHTYRLTECDARHRCGETLLDRRTGRRSPLPLAGPTALYAGLISPDAAFMAVQTFTDDGRVNTQVIRLADGRTMRSTAVSMDGFSSTQGLAVWLSARWLALSDQGRLVLYDSERDELVTPRRPVDGVVRLAWRPR